MPMPGPASGHARTRSRHGHGHGQAASGREFVGARKPTLYVFGQVMFMPTGLPSLPGEDSPMYW